MPVYGTTYNLVDGLVEYFILRQDQQDNKGHVDVMGVSLLSRVQDL